MSTTSLVFDIEADNLYEDSSQVWCICTRCIETDERKSFRPEEIQEALTYLGSASCLIGHNILDYDLPVLEKLYGFTYDKRVVDTLVFSRLLNPDLLGGHSLDAWGKRLGVLKGTFGKDKEEDTIEVFSAFSEEMLKYCEQDVEVTTALFERLINEQHRIEGK